MFIKGISDYNRQGQEVHTGLFAGSAIRDGEINVTQSGKRVGSVSVRAYSRKDGTAAFLTVKAWGNFADTVSSLQKGDAFLAAGRIENREYNGKTYTDLVCDFVIACPSGTAASVPQNFSNLQSRMDNAGFAEIGEEDGELPF